MTLRLQLALTIVATGLITALLVIATVLYAFQRYERESMFERANAFLERIANQVELLDLHQRQPQELNAWMRSVMLYELDSQLYLLDARGTVLSSTGEVKLAPNFKVALAPVQAAAQGASGPRAMPYVMGDDPERMALDTVIAARALQRAVIRNDVATPGYLYLVARQKGLPGSRWPELRGSFTSPVLLLILGIVAVTTALAAATIAAVTRPLHQLTAAVTGISLAALERGGAAELSGAAGMPALGAVAQTARRRDEIGQLALAFERMLTTVGHQWERLRRLDHFRREGVSNLSHDLRSPLTATVACLETLRGRWQNNPVAGGAADDLQLVEVALRNARNAASLVRALGDLAKLDEPTFTLRREVVDVAALLDDIGLRFAQRAADQGIAMAVQHEPVNESPDGEGDSAAPAALMSMLDVELFERGIANLIDNALKFCPRGSRITLATRQAAGWLEVSVSDNGPGIPEEEQPHLFDRYYQKRAGVNSSTGVGGQGLGLAIVKRIVELHDASVALLSSEKGGTDVRIRIAAMPAGVAGLADAPNLSDPRHAGSTPG